MNQTKASPGDRNNPETEVPTAASAPETNNATGASAPTANIKIVPDTAPAPASTTSTPSDASDLDSLWLDPKLGDGIADVNYHSVPVGKPKDFFRTHTDPLYRRRTEIYTHKPEGAIDEQHFIIAPSMRGRIQEARPCTLTCVIYRDGSLRLWPIKFPKDGERDNEAWTSSRNAAKAGLTHWVKLVWTGRAYVTREAQPGYAPDPDESRIPAWNDLVRVSFGENGVIRDESHFIYREVMGIAPRPDSESDDDDGTD